MYINISFVIVFVGFLFLIIFFFCLGIIHPYLPSNSEFFLSQQNLSIPFTTRFHSFIDENIMSVCD